MEQGWAAWKNCCAQQEVLRVRRQNVWDDFRRDRKEDLAHLLSDVKRPGRDGEDVDSEWSVV